jgi:hypothetical protein
LPVEEIDGDEAVAGLDLLGQLPFGLDVGCEWLLGEDVLVIRQSTANLFWTRIRESEKANGIDGRIGEDGIRRVVDGGSRDLFAG